MCVLTSDAQGQISRKELHTGTLPLFLLRQSGRWVFPSVSTAITLISKALQ